MRTVPSAGTPPIANGFKFTPYRGSAPGSSFGPGVGVANWMTREIGRSPPSGGRPRPSLLWHASQLRALKSGPSPSRAPAVAGATIHGLLKNALPIANAARRSTSRFGAGRENACRPVELTVSAPPEVGESNASGGADAFELQPPIAATSAQVSAVRRSNRVLTSQAPSAASVAEALQIGEEDLNGVGRTGERKRFRSQRIDRCLYSRLSLGVVGM